MLLQCFAVERIRPLQSAQFSGGMVVVIPAWVLDYIDEVANIAAILTAMVATVFWWQHAYRRRLHRQEVETFLRLEREGDEHRGASKGLRSMQLIVAHLALTEEQVKKAVFSSGVIRVWPIYEGRESNRIVDLGYQYEPRAKEVRQYERASTHSWVARERRTAEDKGPK